MIRVVGVVIVACAFTFLPAAVLSWRQGYRAARFYLFAWGGIGLAVVVHTARGFGFAPGSLIASHAMQLGVFSTALTLSLVLADRVNLLQAALGESLAEKERLLRAARGALGRGGGREPSQVRVPRPHVARAADAVERRDRLLARAAAAGVRRPHRQAGGVSPGHPRLGAAPAVAHHRHPRPLAHRGRTARARARRASTCGPRSTSRSCWCASAPCAAASGSRPRSTRRSASGRPTRARCGRCSSTCSRTR